MDTSTPKPNVIAKGLALALVLAIVGILLMGSSLTSISAAAQERTFDTRTPAHMPIKFKIKKEKEESVKDLKNEKWLRDFELEVTNTGDRPIYYLEIVMDTGVKPYGTAPEIAFSLRYGRAELGDIVTKATGDDIPIKPGETVSLIKKVPERWEKGVRENRWVDAVELRLDPQVLSFGDGTGYWGHELYPPPRRPQ